MPKIQESSTAFNGFPRQRAGARHTIPPEVILAVRLATRLEDSIAERVPLRRSGKILVGPCPWHKSRSRRSFVVYPQRQSWRCWGCAVGGDVFSFFERFVGISFPAAVKLVAKLAGLELDDNLSEDVSEQFSARTELAQVEARIAEILDAEFMRVARELDRANRMQVRAGFRLAKLSTGAVTCFADEVQFCWSALECAAAALPRLDAEYTLLAFGKVGDRARFVAGDANERRTIIDELLEKGYVGGDRGYRWEVRLQ